MTDEELNAIEARANEATPGPWHAVNGGIKYQDTLIICDRLLLGRHRNLQFTAAARTDIPALIAEIRKLRADVDLLLDYKKLIETYPWAFEIPAEHRIT